jgi:iron only hydrogenase large subunit-like protein
MGRAGYKDVDYVLTTRELGRLFRCAELLNWMSVWAAVCRYALHARLETGAANVCCNIFWRLRRWWQVVAVREAS